MTTPQPAAERDSVRQARQQLNRLVHEIARLTETARSADEFFEEFLPRVLTALGSPAGAVWQTTPAGNLQLRYQINLAEIGLDHMDGAAACHAELLRHALTLPQPRVVPPRSGPATADGAPVPANLSDHVLLLAPVRPDRQPAGLIEVWQEGPGDLARAQSFLPFLASMADLAGGYLRQVQLRQMAGQQELWSQLETFTRQIHGSLDPREVAYLVANEGRRLLECDRVSVALRWGRRAEVQAVSGADVVERRSRLVQAMRGLLDRVLAWGEQVVYTGARDETLPPAVLAALDAYLAESNSKLLIVMPLRDEREKDRPPPWRAAWVAEAFEPAQAPAEVAARMDVLALHVTPALYNAVEHRRIPLRWLWRPLARVQDGLRGRRWIAWAAAAVALALLVGAMVTVTYPLRLDAKGHLVPVERQLVFAPVQGKVVQVRARQGDHVEKGQELVLMEDVELQHKVRQLDVRILAARDAQTTIGERLNQTTSDEERYSLKLEQIKQRYEQRKAEVERGLLLHRTRRPLEAPVVAPRDGTVVTFDAHEQLVGKTVKPGDPLLRVARLDGPWEIELHIPQAHIGPVREALARQGDEPLAVDVLLASQPEHTYRGRLSRDGLGGEATVENNAVVLPARVQITDPELLRQLRGLPVGVEVRARVHCGRRAVGYVMFHELWEFFYEHVWF
jgi:multidrug efflux pump subunit AcrA (membrane-fusion protein)